jgi:hypothetical protein
MLLTILSVVASLTLQNSAGIDLPFVNQNGNDAYFETSFSLDQNGFYSLDTLSTDTIQAESNQIYFENFEILSKYECIGSLDNFSQNLNSGFLVLNKGLELFQSNFKTTGSCWTYVNKVYDLAGYGSAKREVIYDSKKGTLIKDPSIIMPGDWLYHVNYSYGNVEHSAIFICWQDKEKLLAVTLSHVGQNKYAGGNFGIYDLKGVYRVTRPKS